MTPKLTAEQVRLIPDLLWHGAEAYGFRGAVWTCERVAGVLYEEFGVAYSKTRMPLNQREDARKPCCKSQSSVGPGE